MKLSGLKVAITTDSMTQLSGADRFLLGLTKVFPQTDIYSAFYNPKVYPIKFKKLQIFALIKNPLLQKFARFLSFLTPLAFEKLDLNKYDLVISLSAGAAKYINTRSDTTHISVIFTPPHFQFGHHRNLRGNPTKKLINYYIGPTLDPFLRIWDYTATQRADQVITISHYIKRLVKDTYGLDSTVIYPPVEVERFSKLPSSSEDFFLIVSRLFEYKRVDRAIETCNKLNLPLKIIGTGADLKYLQSISGPTIEFLGELPDNEVETYLAKCKAFIFPGTEDFGITPVEAMAAGKPVIAYYKGGVRETILSGKTGEFFRDTSDNVDLPTLDELLAEFDHKKYNVEFMKKHAERFSEKAFIKNIKNYFGKTK
jgi:glycosyltransferase involved in cell wall biosynthesis